ncbi:MAG: SPOR domain-containing protein, partial [Proteobacteria bacterium]|nr:SPOR domain-containing protein [Pseudomonadota bacterium]
MSALILLVLLVGGVLYLGGGLVHLYRYLQARRMHPQASRFWDGQRRRFFQLTGVGVILTIGFFAMAWWSAPGHGAAWMPQALMARQTQLSGPAATDDAETIPPPQVKVQGAVPAFNEARETTSSTTDTTTTTSTTSSTESTVTTTTAPPPAPVNKPVARQGRDAWTVCAASFRREAVAQNYAKRLADQGLPARVNQVDLGKRGTWHRVCV